MTPDDLSSALAPIREHQKIRALRTYPGPGDHAVAEAEVGVLLAAVDEVLAEADEWDATSDSRPLITRGYVAECFRAAIVRGLNGGGGG